MNISQHDIEYIRNSPSRIESFFKSKGFFAKIVCYKNGHIKIKNNNGEAFDYYCYSGTFKNDHILFSDFNFSTLIRNIINHYLN